jgi:prepilin signal peptidase PulO-like enzyme (type II secretory pathway)
MFLILLCAAIGLITGRLLNELADYLPRFPSGRHAAKIPARRRFIPAVLEILGGVLSNKRSITPKTLVPDAAVELLTASFFSYLQWRFGITWNSLLFGFFGSFLILIAVIDLRYRVILNLLILPAAVVTILLSLNPGEIRLPSILLGAGFGLVTFAVAAFVRPGGLGAGDVKLATLLGLFFGFPNVIMPLLVGVLAGGIAAVLLLLTGRGNRSTQFPYAPFLCLGSLIALFFAPQTAFLIPL